MAELKKVLHPQCQHPGCGKLLLKTSKCFGVCPDNHGKLVPTDWKMIARWAKWLVVSAEINALPMVAKIKGRWWFDSTRMRKLTGKRRTSPVNLEHEMFECGFRVYCKDPTKITPENAPRGLRSMPDSEIVREIVQLRIDGKIEWAWFEVYPKELDDKAAK